ncbi:MAG TPA: twin-arginine translocase subunit TatC [Solirubrobacteraceae bacterium]
MSRLRPVGHEDRLSIVDHLDELRTRLIACVIAFLAAFSICYWQNGWLLDTINKPVRDTQSLNSSNNKRSPLQDSAAYQLKSSVAQRISIPVLAGQKTINNLIADKLKLTTDEKALFAQQNRRIDAAIQANRVAAASAPKDSARLPVTLGVTEPFVTTFTVAAYAAVLLALPFILYQIYAFILPAFSPAERKVALPIMLMVPVLFIMGVAFGYFVALPRATHFLLGFNNDQFDILVRAADYYKFAVILIALIGLLFQIPVGVLAVTRLGIISARQLAHNRGYVILGISVVAAVATPTPDPVTMLVAMAPLVVLFEFSVVLARIFERRRAAAASDERWDLDDDLSLS